MSKACKPPFPAWLDRARRKDARRWAKMSPAEIVDDINRRGEEAERWATEHAGSRPSQSSSRKRILPG